MRVSIHAHMTPNLDVKSKAVKVVEQTVYRCIYPRSGIIILNGYEWLCEEHSDQFQSPPYCHEQN